MSSLTDAEKLAIASEKIVDKLVLYSTRNGGRKAAIKQFAQLEAESASKRVQNFVETKWRVADNELAEIVNDMVNLRIDQSSFRRNHRNELDSNGWLMSPPPPPKEQYNELSSKNRLKLDIFEKPLQLS